MPLFEKGPVLAENATIGGDGDSPGIAQDITLDDIRAIAFSDEPLEERREELKWIRAALDARDHADRGHEFDNLLAEIDRLDAELEPGLAGVEGDGQPGMDPQTRTDAMPSDEAEDYLRRKGGEG
ncbi:hypothetical protein ACLB6G_01335 [Zhengella sp. ZM62]|uniref:hypothetical protein n=1 Tax=Zhengella sedimenti TaxID=3390035 RepID=UPI003974DFE6